jgi:hypothetical protein
MLNAHKEFFLVIPDPINLKKQAEFYRRMGRKCLKKIYIVWVKKVLDPKIKIGSYVIQGMPKFLWLG